MLRFVPVVACAALAGTTCSRADPGENLWQVDLQAQGEYATDSLLPGGSARDAGLGHAGFEFDWGRLKKLLGKDVRHVQLHAGAAVRGIRESGSDVRGGAGGLGASVDWDPSHKLALGVLVGIDAGRFGDLDSFNRAHVAGAAMFSLNPKDECQTRTLSAFQRWEWLDDRLHEGDALLDRSDEGGYRSRGFELDWTFGDVKGTCWRPGVFRRVASLGNGRVQGGFEQRRLSTAGSRFAGRERSVQLAGQLPLDRDHVALEGRLDLAWTDLGRPPSARQLENAASASVALRYRPGNWRPGESRLRHLDVQFGLGGQTRDGERPRWIAFAGLDVQWGNLPSGPGTGGSSNVQKRAAAGASEIKVQKQAPP